MKPPDQPPHKDSVPVHAEAPHSLLQRLCADPAAGLTHADAVQRLERDGPNTLPQPEGPNRLRQFFAQFANPIVLTLLGAAVIAIIDGVGRSGGFLSRFGDATAIFLIVALNAALGYYQEIRAEAALDALKKMQTPNARVRRNDQVLVIPAADLVVGDILELEAGDAVPADARILQAIQLAAEESALTGESTPVGKDPQAAVPSDAPIGDRVNMLFVGTTIIRGKGRAVVVSTAGDTELGKLSALIGASRDRTTPLEERLEHFGKRILWACLALSALLFVRGLAKGVHDWRYLLLEAVSLAVAAIPEGLPAITTITLALGVQRMAKRGAIIRKLAAVETLGAATVICTDKTGTLTQNEMTVREVFVGGSSYRVTGVGYEPKGELIDAEGVVVVEPKPALRRLVSTMALCNNATLEEFHGGWRVVGDPTEGALLTLAAKVGLPRESIVLSHRIVKELPFDSDRKRMSIVTLDDRERQLVHTKGSADVLLPLCSNYQRADSVAPLDDTTRASVMAQAEIMSAHALRVLAVARRELIGADGDLLSAPDEDSDQALETQLTFLGLVGMVDPPRVGVREAIQECASAHVHTVMITGDHKLTAMAIAKELGLWEDGALAFTGTELDKLSDEALAQSIDHARVFARVTAEQKLRIVRAYKAAGHVVAMTGDGVNDAPALREAHIGVAMGKKGTDVARQAADMVIADDNFATIVHAVREGRAIYRNIQKFIFFLLSSNAGLVVTVFVASFVDRFEPLTPLMILWINLVTNGLPALALGVDPPDASQMQEPPRARTEGLLGAREYGWIMAVGVWMGATALACYELTRLVPGPLEAANLTNGARAVAFSLLALSPLFHAFNCRSSTVSVLWLRPLVSLPLLVAVVLSAGIHLVAVLVPTLQPVFKTFPLSSTQWLLLIVLSWSIVPFGELLKLWQQLQARLRRQAAAN
ncbi:MAG: cation-translocating P-type ATPase [Myxococcales bacterium]